MSNVADLELCQTLYELSGWDDTSDYWEDRYYKGKHFTTTLGGTKDGIKENGTKFGHTVRYNYPAYDAGYLLRKLPPSLLPFKNQRNVRLRLYPSPRGGWTACYISQDINKQPTRISRAPTPESALCLLAIKLFNQNILKKDKE